MYKLDFKIPKYKAKIIESHKFNKIVDSVSLSFPFGVSLNYKPKTSDIEIARDIVIKLIDRRVLNSKECCGNCINDSINSIKEIKSDLIGIKSKLLNNLDEPLYYLIDYIIAGINVFFDFMERYSNDIEANKEIYFSALETIRNHTTDCLHEISKIGNIKIDKKLYAYRTNRNEWDLKYYCNNTSRSKNIII